VSALPSRRPFLARLAILFEQGSTGQVLCAFPRAAGMHASHIGAEHLQMRFHVACYRLAGSWEALDMSAKYVVVTNNYIAGMALPPFR
jgi:hypothetical protein